VELYNPVGVEFWLVAEPLLLDAIRRDNTHTPESVYQLLKNNQADLWLHDSHQTAGVTFWLPAVDGPILHVWLGGGRLKELEEMLPSVEEWGRQHGAARLMLTGRAGWEKVLPGFKRQAVLMTKEL
jgi:hypothetical protein